MINAKHNLSGRNAIWSVLVTLLALASSQLHAAPVGNTSLGQGALEGNKNDYNTALGFYPMSNINGGNDGTANTAVGVNALYSNMVGNYNTALGSFALQKNTTGSNNVAVGNAALYNNTQGNSNVAVGDAAMHNNNTGSSNTGVGVQALSNNTTGTANTGIGHSALAGGTAGLTGSKNTASGVRALANDTSGSSNVASGTEALFFNTTGNDNCAYGAGALMTNSTGVDNTATGSNALFANNASFNTADGQAALKNNTEGEINTASGARALFSNTQGSNNAAHGAQAMLFNKTGNDNTADGFNALAANTSGSNNIAVGANAGSGLTTGNNNIVIGAVGAAGESNTIRIGKINVHKIAYMQGISGATVANGVAVRVDSAGHLGTLTSSARFKEAIKPMEKASEALLALQPVTFRYKEELDPKGIPQFGLVAEEVEKVNPNLVVRDADGKVNTVRYEAVNAMLLNEFLKEHKEVQGLKDTVARQQKEIEALTAGLRKVSDEVRLGTAASSVTVSQR